MRIITSYFLAALALFAGCITPRKGPRKALANAAQLVPFDAIIVPGIPYNGEHWDSVMKARVLWSYILYRNGYTRNVIYSGGAIYTPYVEARVMGAYGQALGIPAEHIFFDSSARHSTENVYHSYLIAKEQGFKTIALASDPYQSFLLRGFTRKRFGTPIYHIPFVIDSLQVYRHLHPVLDLKYLKKRRWQSITDQQGFGERFRGTMGRDIDWSKHPDGRVEAL